MKWKLINILIPREVDVTNMLATTRVVSRPLSKRMSEAAWQFRHFTQRFRRWQRNNQPPPVKIPDSSMSKWASWHPTPELFSRHLRLNIHSPALVSITSWGKCKKWMKCIFIDLSSHINHPKFFTFTRSHTHSTALYHRITHHSYSHHTAACGLGAGIEPLTLWSVDDPLYILSHTQPPKYTLSMTGLVDGAPLCLPASR